MVGTLSDLATFQRAILQGAIAMPTGFYERPSLEERLFSRIEIITETGCWIFMGHVGGNGYSQIQGDSGRVIGGHVAAYNLYKGEIPSKYVIDHLCRVKCCVNPDHLEAVTNTENIARGNKPGRPKKNATA